MEDPMEAHFCLKKLIIQNFATFKNQAIHFKPGFNAIIGETGSGKSLVLDALQLILGGRADKKVVRRETEFSLIEAVFFCSDLKVKSFLEEEGFPLEGQEIVIKRLIYKNGITKNYINHLSCTVTFLSLFSRKFIDLVGQFENQKLLSESYQLHLLDQYAQQIPELDMYQQKLKILKQYKKEQAGLVQSKSFREQRLDYLIFQLQEIEKLNPSSQDEEALLKKKNIIMSLERTQKISFQINESFDGSEDKSGLFETIKFLHHLFAKNADIFGDKLDLLVEIDDKIHHLQNELNKKINSDTDPADLDVVLDRLDSYQNLKKKFGGTIESIQQTQVQFVNEKIQLEALDIDLNQIGHKISQLHLELEDLAGSLHQKRLKYSLDLEDKLSHRIRSLKMNGASIKIKIEKLDELTENGFSKAIFLTETNPGEGFFKIKDIASGGELSRILLSLRQILSSHDSISIFLFDEIDSGIGGETATSIGKALYEVSLNGQVIAITHLPQIAQFAETLIVINKDIHASKTESRTESTVKEISGKFVRKEVKAMAQLS